MTPVTPSAHSSTSRLFTLLALCLLAASLLAAGCSPGAGEVQGDEAATVNHEMGEHLEHGDEEEIELAVPMAHLQRHSAKLGYAIEGRNARLADFYLTETGEALEDLREVETYEGFPIARQVEVIMDPSLPPLRDALAEEDWPAAATAYEAVIEACNRCHAGTGHEFVVIEPARLPAPYNQRFTPAE